MRTLLSFLFASSGSRTSRRGRVARRSRVAPGERLEPRINLSATLIDLASARAASNGFPAYGELPIPAGATLVDVSDKGDIVLFSSTDTNVVAGQQTVPSIHPNLFWLNTTTGETRLVTHRAGSTVQHVVAGACVDDVVQCITGDIRRGCCVDPAIFNITAKRIRCQ